MLFSKTFVKYKILGTKISFKNTQRKPQPNRKQKQQKNWRGESAT